MSRSIYFRPLVGRGPTRPSEALPLAGGVCWFDRAEEISRDGSSRIVPVSALPAEILAALTTPRSAISQVTLNRTRIMGIVNVTPDSFSDGGLYQSAETAISHGLELVKAGADILDVGGESTRPGAEAVEIGDEIGRVEPVIGGLVAKAPVSVDTRKAPVARAAVGAGAGLVNDVSGFGYDPDMAQTVAELGVPVCVMHTQGTPETMQNNPSYDNVLLDVYDYLADRLADAAAAGIPTDRVIVDPGIGFGKTIQHNLALLRGISLFHSLGCAILVGASRKGFVGTLTGAGGAASRVAGSVAVAQAMAAQGVQVIRVHDVAETRQALAMDAAICGDNREGE